jgi:hypothetical protein
MVRLTESNRAMAGVVQRLGPTRSPGALARATLICARGTP